MTVLNLSVFACRPKPNMQKEAEASASVIHEVRKTLNS